MVDIYVGPKRKHWCLHKDLLCNRSSFFEAALGGNFKEAKEGVMYLPEDDSSVFEIFVNWLYGPETLSASRILPINGEIFDDRVMTVCKLYILCSKLCVESLMNTVMDRVRKYHRENNLYPSRKVLVYVFGNVVSTSLIYKYFAHEAASEMSKQECKNPQKFVRLMHEHHDLAVIIATEMAAWWKEGGISDPAHEKNCLFHEHKDTEKCGD